MSRTWPKAALATVALALSIGVGEFVLRLMYPVVHLHRTLVPGPYVEHPDREYALAPNYRGVYWDYYGEAAVTTNRLGLRGPEPRTDEATLRVLCIGDSVTFGMGVADDVTFPVQLENRLRELGRDVEVWNAGVPGYATHHALRTLEWLILELRPHLVVLTWLQNDLPTNPGGPEPVHLVIDGYQSLTVQAYEDFRRRHFESPWWRKLRLVQVPTLWNKLRRAGRQALAAELEPMPIPPASIRGAVERIREVNDVVNAAGARLLVLVHATREEVRDNTIHPAVQEVQRRLHRHAIPSVRLLTGLREAMAAGGNPYVERDNVHLTGDGNEVLARTVCEFLESWGS